MTMQRGTIGKWAAGGLAVLLLAGGAVALASGGFSGTATSFSKAGQSLGGASATTVAADAARSPSAAIGAASGPASAPGSGGPTDLGGTPLPGVTSKVVKTGELQLEVKRHRLDDAYADAIGAATRAGGYLAGVDRSALQAVLTIKVPADKFETLLAELSQQGKVKGTQVHGEDVTAQYVDLEARLRNWRAQEAVFLDLMANAKTIGDTITVQQQLSTVQQQIEQLEGQQRLLDGQSSFSTLTVSIAEPGVVVASSKPQSESTIVKAWHRAWNASAAVVGGVLIVLGFAIPLALVLLLVLLIARPFYRRTQRATPARS